MKPQNISKKKLLITNKLGLHARAAAKFVKITSKCSSITTVQKGRKVVNGSSILGLMTLAAKKGSEISITCKGPSAEKDIESISKLILNNFGEEEPIKEGEKKEKVYTGIGVSPGVAIGNCFLSEKKKTEYRKYPIKKQELKRELDRFDKAVKDSIEELKHIIKVNNKKTLSKNNEMSFILEAHIQMLKSSSLVKDSRRRIQKQLINAEYAIEEELSKHALIFKNLKDDYFRERFDDVEDICRRLINCLQTESSSQTKVSYKKNLIMISKNFSAADIMSINKNSIAGLISAYGGPEGHFSIVARSLSIPTIVGIKDLIKNIRDGDDIVLDGDQGLVILNPGKMTLAKYRNKLNEIKNQSDKLNLFKTIYPKTKDDKRIFIEANVDDFSDAKEAVKNGINGIGLYRSEYLYMNKKKLPTEEKEFQMIKKTLLILKKKILTIRTLDIGNDKNAEQIDKLVGPSQNPALGLRAIRLTLAFPEIFKKQISAILRANYFGKIRIMLPMVSHLYELKAAKKIIKDVHKGLINKKMKVKKNLPPIGVLIETPAAALISNILAKHCDFFAIGTNDLVMYTLAIDRGDDNVAYIYDPSHLSVLRLIKMSKESADKNNIPISVCGEMAGDSVFSSFLIGLGIDTLSMSTSRILKSKQFIQNVNYADAIKLCENIFKDSNYGKTKKILKEFSEKINNL